MAFSVYILRCSDGSYYTGHTEDLEARLAGHRMGRVAGYTQTRRPVSLVFSQQFASREEAFAAERQIKGWTRAKKEALIRGELSRLPMLASSSFDKLRTSGG